MDSMNTRESRMRIAKKILKINKELKERNKVSVDEQKRQLHLDRNFITKLQNDKRRLQAELRHMCSKIVMLDDEIIAALSP
ncbi:uncharacterized protein LOC118071498 [Chelonus insularis]|uniref:uncharacterized protein LOC118071498 n=1 Tax=Chelonus insularis TaxID=460826 RepID=UPI0020CA0018|nr:uncharacterized protein LOC118071498 [Chelonus insularis]KAG8148323.1 CiV19.5g2-like-7 protein [Chelonus insularis]